MSDKTGIEWADATWNPVTGCTKVSEGCRNCYAKSFAERFKGVPGHYFESGFAVTLRPDKLEQPLRWTRPRKIFVNSMSDLFHPDVPFDFIGQVFSVMGYSSHHTFMVLTKRPGRMLEFMKWYQEINKDPVSVSSEPFILPNVWIGVSVENQQAADERIPLLLQTPAAVRFLSCEPLLGSVDLNHITLQLSDAPERGKPAISISALRGWYGGDGAPAKVDWVIVGGESGDKARPMHPWWVQELRDQCQAADVPFFFKQWGEWRETHALACNEPGIKGKPWFHFDPDTSMCRIGKQAAGRDLDGRTWEEFPGEAQP